MELLKETEAAQLMNGRRARSDSENSEHSDVTASDNGEDEGDDEEPALLQAVSSAGDAVPGGREAAEEGADPSLDASDTAAAAAIAGLSLLEAELLPAGERQSKNGTETPLHGEGRQRKERRKKQKQKQKQKLPPSEVTRSRLGSKIKTESGNDENEADVEAASDDGLSSDINAQAESMLGR